MTVLGHQSTDMSQTVVRYYYDKDGHGPLL